MKATTTLVWMTLALTLVPGAFAQATLGAPLPALTARSGDGQVLSPNQMKDHVVVLYYETKELKELNREAKVELAKVYDGLPERARALVFRLPLVDASSAFWPITSIWESNLVKNSKIEGLTIYGDWDASARKALGFSENEAYVVVTDRLGVVRWVQKGRLSSSDIQKLETLLTTLTGPSR